jgi:hypothetical protein
MKKIILFSVCLLAASATFGQSSSVTPDSRPAVIKPIAPAPAHVEPTPAVALKKSVASVQPAGTTQTPAATDPSLKKKSVIKPVEKEE